MVVIKPERQSVALLSDCLPASVSVWWALKPEALKPSPAAQQLACGAVMVSRQRTEQLHLILPAAHLAAVRHPCM